MAKAKTNIFLNARKELSQDAVLATLLATGTDISQKLLKVIVEKYIIRCGSDFPPDFSIKSVNLQEQGIDILVEIESNDKIYAVIIEDKTDTEMHDEQMSRYINKCFKKKDENGKNYSGVYYIYFKSGMLKFWEIDCFNKEIERINNPESADLKFGCFIANYQEYVNYISKCSTRSEFENAGYVWISLYIDYLKSQNCHSNWMQYNKDDHFTLSDFLGKLIDKKVDYDSSGVKIGYAPGGGKRNPELWFEGICGFAAKRREELTQKSTLNDTYYFLPIMTMYDEKVEIYLQYHLFGNPSHSHGYMPKDKLKNKNSTLFKEYSQICENMRKVVETVSNDQSSLLLKKCDNGYLKIAKAEYELNVNARSKISPLDDFFNNNPDVITAVNQALIAAKFFKDNFDKLSNENNLQNLACELRRELRSKLERQPEQAI